MSNRIVYTTWHGVRVRRGRSGICYSVVSPKGRTLLVTPPQVSRHFGESFAEQLAKAAALEVNRVWEAALGKEKQS